MQLQYSQNVEFKLYMSHNQSPSASRCSEGGLSPFTFMLGTHARATFLGGMPHRLCNVQAVFWYTVSEQVGKDDSVSSPRLYPLSKDPIVLTHQLPDERKQQVVHDVRSEALNHQVKLPHLMLGSFPLAAKFVHCLKCERRGAITQLVTRKAARNLHLCKEGLSQPSA